MKACNREGLESCFSQKRIPNSATNICEEGKTGVYLRTDVNSLMPIHGIGPGDVCQQPARFEDLDGGWGIVDT